jgi:hypothetical protein
MPDGVERNSQSREERDMNSNEELEKLRRQRQSGVELQHCFTLTHVFAVAERWLADERCIPNEFMHLYWGVTASAAVVNVGCGHVGVKAASASLEDCSCLIQ